jgi:hypothetical protein
VQWEMVRAASEQQALGACVESLQGHVMSCAAWKCVFGQRSTFLPFKQRSFTQKNAGLPPAGPSQALCLRSSPTQPLKRRSTRPTSPPYPAPQLISPPIPPPSPETTFFRQADRSGKNQNQKSSGIGPGR